MVEEVRRLHDAGLSWEELERFGLEYRYVSVISRKQINREEMIQNAGDPDPSVRKEAGHLVPGHGEKGDRYHLDRRR